MEDNQNTIAAINHQRARRIIFCGHFFRQSLKNWPLSRGYFGSSVSAVVGVTIVERWPLLEVRL